MVFFSILFVSKANEYLFKNLSNSISKYYLSAMHIVSQTFAYWTIFGKFLNHYRPSKIFPNFFCGQAIITTYNFCHLFMLQCVLNFFCINLLLGALASFRKTSIVDRCHRHFATQFTVKMK